MVLDNLKPICSKCNTSMGSRYTIEEWNGLAKVGPKVDYGSTAKQAAPVVDPPRGCCW